MSEKWVTLSPAPAANGLYCSKPALAVHKSCCMPSSNPDDSPEASTIEALLAKLLKLRLRMK